MTFITDQRLTFAFNELTPEDGGDFERFVSSILIKEMPDLRPVAGMHDGARDAFIYVVGKAETSFLQSSVTAGWARKINDTIRALKKNGNTVKEFIYCTSRAIISEADTIRTSLRDNGISLDIRDRGYFCAVANNSSAHSATCEAFSKKFVDPVLAQNRLIDSSAGVLTDREEKLALVYFDLLLRDKDSEMALTKFSFDSLVTYALKDATPKQPISESDILRTISDLLPSHNEARSKILVKATLQRLASKKIVRHHAKEDVYSLDGEKRGRMAESLIGLAAEQIKLKEEIIQRTARVAAESEIDYEFDSEQMASDVINLLDQYFGTHSQAVATAVMTSKNYQRPFSSSYDLAQEAIANRRSSLASLASLEDQQFLDIAPLVVDSVLESPSTLSRQYFQKAADAYLLMFFLRETPDVQKAISKMFQGGNLYIDTSYIIPCFAETVLPEADRRFIGLLQCAREANMKLFVTDDVLNELLTHLKKVRYVYRRNFSISGIQTSARRATTGSILLISAFLKEKEAGRIDTIETFIYRLMGRDSKTDLIDTLREVCQVEYRPTEDDLAKIDKGTLEWVIDEWRRLKNKRAGMDEEAFDILVRHDAKAYMLVQQLRKAEGTTPNYGYSTWWLTLDRTAFRVQQELKRKDFEFETRVSSCMSPDFLLRYLSIAPRKEPRAAATAHYLPLSVEMAATILIPPEMRSAAEQVLERTRNEPRYVQRRKLQELSNNAKSERGEMLESGIDVVERSIEELFLEPEKDQEQ